MKFKQVIGIVFISAATTVASVWGYNKFIDTRPYIYNNSQSEIGKVPSNYAGFFDTMNGSSVQLGPDFTGASSAAIPATVHITTKMVAQSNIQRRSPFSDLFGDDFDMFFGNPGRAMPQQASGSGAIISEDGYIVTNNHVVTGANEITVRLSNRKSFTAKLVGADPSSDLAVLKIEAKGLPFLVYGNSEDVKVGQWVLAIGYPLNLQTTVTAGIVSAKGRTLEINSRNMKQSQANTSVESFIQTDAAVNPGNSGGPLVSTDGKLIGINSAIASPTGSYAGYSFTIPVNIVKKIVDDLVKHGTVQRAFLGVEYPKEDFIDAARKEAGVVEGDGIFVSNVVENGAAARAGIKKGDLITKINGLNVYNGADLVGQMATFSPGDKITVTYTRAGKETSTKITLLNGSYNTDVVKFSVDDKLGASLATLDPKIAKEMGVKGGVVVKSIDDKGAFSKTRMESGFVILRLNGKEVTNVEEFKSAISKLTGPVKLDGMYEGYEGVFSYPLRLE